MRTALLTLAFLAACAGAARAGPPPVLAGHEQGRTVWTGTCEVCHAEPASGAPQLGDAEAWAPRIAKGTTILHQHAVAGFVGPKGDEMPARGGNASLTDSQIQAAVDYMVAASKP